MRYPTRKALEAELAAVCITHPSSTLTLLVAAIERARVGGPNEVDGYPASTMGSGSSSTDPERLTSVETAASRLLIASGHHADERGARAPRTDPDPLESLLQRSLRSLSAIGDAITAHERDVRALREFMGVDGPKVRRCEITLDEAYKFSDVGGRLHRKYELCRPCYDFVLREGRIPTEAEAEEYRRTGMFIRRVRASAAR